MKRFYLLLTLLCSGLLAVSQSFTVSQHLKTGWNIIGYYGNSSLPIQQALQSVWNYVEVAKDMENFYMASNHPQLNGLDSIYIGKAYFIKVTQDCELLYSGCKPPLHAGEGSIYTSIFVTLSEGWNLASYYGYQNQAIQPALQSIWEDLDIIKNMDNFYKKNHTPELNGLQNLTIGYGYLIYVNNPSELELKTCIAATPTPTYTLQLSIAPSLSGSTIGSGSYTAGESVAIQATPAEGYEFESWKGDIEYVADAYSATTSITMPEKSILLTAQFSQIPASTNRNFTDTVNGVPFSMIFVESGTYQRGCANCAEQDKQYETPVHNVTVSDFHIAQYEITNAQWIAVMGGTLPWGAQANTPKIGVSWFEANEFICQLNSITGRNYRLATDAEWEFAARGGSVGVALNHKYSGSNNADEVAWHSGNSGGQAKAVGTKAANELGLYDMSGNAWEWVYDWLVGYTATDKTDPVQIIGSGNKTRRGGSFDEPMDYARVSRRAIRSRDGAAGMGFRIAHSPTLPEGMKDACIAANPAAAACEGLEHRDCRLILEADEIWEGDGNMLIIRSNGAAAVSGYPSVSGQWYTLNNRSLNIVNSNGTTSTYAYYVFSEDEMTMINADGMPYRLYKRKSSEVSGAPTVPSLPSPTPLEQLIAQVEPARMVTQAQLENPDTTLRDPRLIPTNGNTWFMDGRCCGGNHKYRFHLQANGDAEFVVMDYDDTHKENVLAKGRWFTVGNIALHIMLDGQYYNYLYTVGNRTMSFSEYMPAGPIFSHISFQSYERGDFRIFSTYPYDDNVKRPRGFMGDNPVYPPGPYQTQSE